MPVEKSAGAVIFRREPFDVAQGKNNIFYLLLNYPSSAKASKAYWDFPKGHIEKGEKEVETVKREVEEEAGLKDIEFIEGFKEWIKYFFRFEGKNIFKFVIFYLVQTKTKDVKISEEHIGYNWLPYEEALEKLTFKNAKEVLKKAKNFISGKSI